MSDFLLDLSKNPQARRLIKSVGLPIPMPTPLRRAKGPMDERPLSDLKVVVAAAPGSELSGHIAEILAPAGADPLVHSSVDIAKFQGPGEAWGRPATAVGEGDADGQRVHALVFDATGISSAEELRALYDVFHPWAGSIAKSGRVVVIGRPPASIKDPARSAAQAALSGFTRSFSKEISQGGATANLIYVQSGAERQLAGPLRFILSARSAYLDGQPMTVTKKVKDTSLPRWTRVHEGKVALVTGAARGIGEQIARRLAAEGAAVIVLDIPQADALASKLARDIGGQLLLCDITAADAPKQIADFCNEKFGGVDIVVHNAGVTRDKTLKRMKPEYWDQAVDINLGAVIRINDYIEKRALRDNGRIVCLSSVSGIAGNRGQTNYSASKSGLIAYCEAYGTKLATRGITVNGIAPGFIETRLTASMPVANREVARRLNSLGQGGQPIDVAEAVTFLTTPGASGVTGNTIRVCGGMMIGA